MFRVLGNEGLYTLCTSQVKEPEKYGFDPKYLLSHLADIYLHLNSDEFARAVARDEVWHFYSHMIVT